MYDNVQLFMAGTWRPARAGGTLPVVNPATQAVLDTVAHAEIADIDEALEAASRGFASLRNVAAFDRSKLLRTAAAHLRERIESIAPILTQEQGKPLEEARLEIGTSADILEWFAEEARRGRVIPSRTPGVRWWVDKEPVGPVAAFSPWNFPVAQAARKLGAALAGAHMKRVTMELGGHAPVIVFDDTDIERSSKILARGKYRNAGKASWRMHVNRVPPCAPAANPSPAPAITSAPLSSPTSPSRQGR